MSEFKVHSSPASVRTRVLATVKRGGVLSFSPVAPVALNIWRVIPSPCGVEHDGSCYETGILRYLDRVLPMPSLTPPTQDAPRNGSVMNVNDWYLFQCRNVIGFMVIGPRSWD